MWGSPGVGRTQENAKETPCLQGAHVLGKHVDNTPSASDGHQHRGGKAGREGDTETSRTTTGFTCKQGEQGQPVKGQVYQRPVAQVTWEAAWPKLVRGSQWSSSRSAFMVLRRGTLGGTPRCRLGNGSSKKIGLFKENKW